MIDFEVYAQIPFASKEISMAELLLFGEDHVGRLISKNANGPDAGRFTAILAATEAAFNPFNELMSARDSAEAARQGKTIDKNTALKLFKNAVSQQEGLIRAKLGAASSGYQEFFPHGVTEYRDATLAKAEVLMDRMVTKSTAYQAQLGAELVTLFTDLRTQYMNARGTQVQVKGTVSDAGNDLKDARTALERQLTLNLLDLAKMYLGLPERLKDFFNQSLIKKPRAKKEEPPAPPAPPPA